MKIDKIECSSEFGKNMSKLITADIVESNILVTWLITVFVSFFNY